MSGTAMFIMKEKQKKVLKTIMLVPLILATLWLIMLIPSYNTDEMMSPSMLPGLMKGIGTFIIVWGIAVMIFFGRLR